MAPPPPLVLPPRVAREVVASAFDELCLPVGAPPEQVAATFRVLSLQRALGMSADSSSSAKGSNNRNSNNSNRSNNNNRSINNSNGNHEGFQRQAIAYRFLSSLPLLDATEYRPEHMLATLRPLTPATGDDTGERASAMLDVTIASMEQAQRAWGLPYTNYVITVHYWMRTHVVRRRYSEFLALHRVLERKLPVVPQLPAREWRYKLRLPPSGAVRAQELSQYLLRVINSLAARGFFSLDVMDFLDVDFRRVRAQEEALAVSYLTHVSGASSSGYYIICSGWLAAWKCFVQSADAARASSEQPHVASSHVLPPPPGKISNDHLVDAVTRAPKDSLAPAHHYRCVNAPTWQYLARVYGVSGPVLARKQPSIYSSVAADATALAVRLQALVRGFLGRCAARRRRVHVQQLHPETQTRVARAQRRRLLAERMAVVRKYVDVREYQTRYVAARKIQRAFRAFVLRAEHALLLAESAVPAVDSGFARVHEYLSLEEVGLLQDPRAKLAHFLVALSKGVPVQKLRSRRKTPKWRLFSIDAIASQLRWSSTARSHALAFVDVTGIAIEAPVVLKTVLRRKSSTAGLAQAVVVTYLDGSGGDGDAGGGASDKDRDSKDRDKNKSKRGELRELLLVCESACDCEALHFGLSALVAETQARVAHGASYVDGHGAIRRKAPHAKRLLREAQELLDQHTTANRAPPPRMHAARVSVRS